jgi:hypothetical protein
MRRLVILLIVLIVGTTWLGACGPPRVEAAQGPVSPGFGMLPTSPAGGADDPSASIPARLMLRARAFRGNPGVLAVLDAAVLLVAVGLGIYTLSVAYRRSPGGGR